MAGRDVIYGILVQARENVSDALKKAGVAAKTHLGKDMSGAAEKAKKNLEFLSTAVTGLNQGLELMKKAFETAKVVFEQTIARSIEQRSVFDQQRQDWIKMTQQLERLAGLIGDLLIPIILGIADAFGPATDSAEEYLKANRAIIGADLVEFLSDTARVLTSGVAVAIDLGAKAWFGWLEIIEAVKLAGNRMFEALLEGIGFSLEEVSKLARMLGADELAASLEQAAVGASGLGDEFERSGDKAAAELARLVAEQKRVEQQIEKVAATVDDAIGRVSVAAMRRFTQEVKKAPPAISELEEKLRELQRKRLEAAFELNQRHITDFNDQLAREAAMLERRVKDDEAWRDHQQESMELTAQRSQELSDMISGFADQLVDDMTFAMEVIRDDNLSTAEKIVAVSARVLQQLGQHALEIIVQNAYIAGSEAYAAHAGIPWVGIAIGAAQAAVAIAQVIAMAASLDVGGQVQQDGLAFLHREELVVPRDRVKSFSRAAAELGMGDLSRTQTQPMMGGRVGSMEVPVVVNYHSMASPTSKTEARHAAHNVIIPAVRGAARLEPIDLLAVG